MKAVILAGGLGMRLRPLTEVIPKPLLPLGEKAILEVQIERLKKSGLTISTLPRITKRITSPSSWATAPGTALG